MFINELICIFDFPLIIVSYYYLEWILFLSFYLMPAFLVHRRSRWPQLFVMHELSLERTMMHEEAGDERIPDVHDPLTGRPEFLNYCLSLKRAHNGEHADTLAVIDVSSLKRIAYIFVALICYIRSSNESSPYGDNDNADDYMSDVFNETVCQIIK